MAKIDLPNEAQAKALCAAATAANGNLPADTGNEKRTAAACARRGWAVRSQDGRRWSITDSGRLAIGADPVDPPVDQPPSDDVPEVDLRDEHEAEHVAVAEAEHGSARTTRWVSMTGS